VACVPASPCGKRARLVETAFLQRIYVTFLISLATRRIEYLASTSNPDGRWVTQQACNLVMQLAAPMSVFRTEGIKVVRAPIQARNANAHAERWVRTVRSDCLDRGLIFGRRHLVSTRAQGESCGAVRYLRELVPRALSAWLRNLRPSSKNANTRMAHQATLSMPLPMSIRPTLGPTIRFPDTTGRVKPCESRCRRRRRR
jgi:hypothetical protein